MQHRAIDLIESWFAAHDDGEFAVNERCMPYAVVGPADRHSRVLYTTKVNSMSVALSRSATMHRFSMIGRYGVPARPDLKWIKEVVGPRRLFFVGDADPPDLMIFRWMQILLDSRNLVYLGVSDRMLKSLAITIQKSYTIPLSRSEREAIPVLEKVFPDYPSVLGPDCARLLQQKRKIETEVLVSFSNPANAVYDHIWER